MKTAKLLFLLISTSLFITCDKFVMPSYPVCISQFNADNWSATATCHTLSAGYDYAQDSYPKLDFVNESIGFLFTYQTIHKTIDGGGTFAPVITDLPCKPEIIEFVDEMNGFCFARDLTDVCASGAFYKTSDGGSTWQIVFDSVKDHFDLVWTLDFFDQMHGIAMTGDVNYQAYAIVTSDGGMTWTRTSFHNFKKYRQKIQLLDNSTAYALGEDGEIYVTNNKGYSWDSIMVSNYEVDLYQFLSPDTAFAYFNYGLYKTVDSGSTWINVVVPEDINESEDARGDVIDMMHFSDQQHGILTGTGYYIVNAETESTGTPYTATYTTSDGGITWNTAVTNSFKRELDHFPDANTGYLWDGVQNLVRLLRF